MDTKALRQKILDLAIHGKLVPQDPNDEPASVLLERIRTEKERLIKEGKIKKGKKSAKTSDKPHYPYELPKGWEWTTIGELFMLQAGKNITAKYISPEQSESHKYPCYGGNGIRGFVTNSNRRGEFPIIGRQGALCGNVNLAIGEFYATEHAVIVDRFSNTDLMWAYYTLIALNLNQYATATAQPGLAVSVINDVIVPIPPLQEQCRISKTITLLFSLIDEIEHGKQNLKDTIKQAKTKVLDLAIHGKLVPQDPNDEPATDLLQRINPKAEIISDNGHYQKLPKGWCLVKGKHIFNPMKSCKPIGETFKYIDIDAIDNKRQIISNVKILKVANAPSRASRFTQKGDVVFSLVRPYLRNIAIVSENDCIASTGFYVCHPTEVLLPKYCYHLMISDYVINGLNEFMKGDNSPSINKGDIDNWLFPIPPLAEQKRIVSKIEEIFSQFDAIETAL